MGSSEILSRPTEQLSTPKEQGFDYGSLNSETRIVVQQRTSEIKSLIRQTVQVIVAIGQKLTEVKQQLGHGNFRNWLKVEFEWGIWTATKFMQVAERFECVNFRHLEIAASALYLLAAPSTPEDARKEALERATQGEAISHTKAKAITTRHKAAANLQAPKPVTVNVPAETLVRDLSTPSEPSPALQPVEAQSAAVVKRSEDKLPGEKTQALAHLQVRSLSYDMASATDSGDRPPKDQAEIEIQPLFEVGNIICLTDFEQQEPKWRGEVAKVKKATATEIEVVIKISSQP